MSRQNTLKLLLFGLFLSAHCAAYSQVGQQTSPSGNGLDTLWHLLPASVVKDTFGGRVSENYYALEVVVGNNTGHDLTIRSIAFAPPSPDQSKKSMSLPAVGAAMVAALITNPARLRKFYEASFRPPLLISNDVQARTIVFIPKSFIRLKGNKAVDARMVENALGTLVLIGDEITCKNSMITNGAALSTPKP